MRFSTLIVFLAIAVLLIVVGLVLLFSSSESNSTEDFKTSLEGLTETQTDVYEDNFSSVYIIAQQTRDNHAAVREIINKKRNWEKLNPNKKIVSITMVTGDAGRSYGYPYVAGLLIHYETLAKAQ